jgi:hypothetical protein
VAQVPGDLVHRLARREHQGGGRVPETMEVEPVLSSAVFSGAVIAEKK